MSRPPARRPPPARGHRRAPFELDRIVIMRIVFAAIAVGFLYLMVKVSMIAFGGSSAREAKRIEHAVDPPKAGAPADPTSPPRAGTAPDR